MSPDDFAARPLTRRDVRDLDPRVDDVLTDVFFWLTIAGAALGAALAASGVVLLAVHLLVVIWS